MSPRDTSNSIGLYELRDIGDHRAAIAGTAAKLAAERAVPADITTLREHAERLRGATALTDRIHPGRSR